MRAWVWDISSSLVTAQTCWSRAEAPIPPPDLFSSGFYLPHLSASHPQTRKIPARGRRPCPFPDSSCPRPGPRCRHRASLRARPTQATAWAGRGAVTGSGPDTLREQVWALREVGAARPAAKAQVQHSLAPRLGDGLDGLPQTPQLREQNCDVGQPGLRASL